MARRENSVPNVCVPSLINTPQSASPAQIYGTTARYMGTWTQGYVLLQFNVFKGCSREGLGCSEI